MDNINYYMYYWASQVVLVIKNLSANAEDVMRDVHISWAGNILWRRAQ